MNKDLIIGIALSLAVHSVTLLAFNHKSAAPKSAPKEKETVMQFEMPPLEEEKIDKVEELSDDEPVTNQLAPPSLVDLPTIVPVNAFTQPLTPPPPPGLTPSKGAINIPVIKAGTNFGSNIKNLFNVGDLDQRPVPRVQPQPNYPYEMSRAGVSGNVTVEFIIDTEGNVVQTQVMRSSHREFESAAQQAVMKWKFKPGKKAGRVVNVRASQLIDFTLDGDKDSK
jgi:periplasmic protein TonB